MAEGLGNLNQPAEVPLDRVRDILHNPMVKVVIEMGHPTKMSFSFAVPCYEAVEHGSAWGTDPENTDEITEFVRSIFPEARPLNWRMVNEEFPYPDVEYTQYAVVFDKPRTVEDITQVSNRLEQVFGVSDMMSPDKMLTNRDVSFHNIDNPSDKESSPEYNILPHAQGKNTRVYYTENEMPGLETSTFLELNACFSELDQLREKSFAYEPVSQGGAENHAAYVPNMRSSAAPEKG